MQNTLSYEEIDCFVGPNRAAKKLMVTSHYMHIKRFKQKKTLHRYFM
jgi:hypothetical protein